MTFLYFLDIHIGHDVRNLGCNQSILVYGITFPLRTQKIFPPVYLIPRLYNQLFCGHIFPVPVLCYTLSNSVDAKV